MLLPSISRLDGGGGAPSGAACQASANAITMLSCPDPAAAIRPITVYRPKNPAALDYMALAAEVAHAQEDAHGA